MSECQLSAFGRDRTNHSHWTDRYALFGLCGMAREPYHPQLCTQFTQELYVVTLCPVCRLQIHWMLVIKQLQCQSSGILIQIS